MIVRHVVAGGAALVGLLWVSAPALAQLDLGPLWPNEDGRSWEYRQVTDDATSPTEIQVSRLRFEGTQIVPGGHETQVLIAEGVEILGGASATASRDPFLNLVWRVRPDLRPALETRGVFGSAQSASWMLTLLHGGAFVKTEERIFTRRTDVDLVNWIYLDAELTPGATLQFQPVPDLASDVIVELTHGGWELVSVPAGELTAVRMDYFVDFGQSFCTSAGSPEPEGTFKSTLTGSIHFVVGWGPVRCYEELAFSDIVDCTGVEEGVWSTGLAELNVAPVPTLETTWGRLKAGRYR